MPDLCLDVVIYLALFTLGILWIGWVYLDTGVQRMFWISSQAFLYIWSGFGAAYEGVSRQYRCSYVAFAISMGAAFFAVLRFTGPMGERFYARTRQGAEEFFGRKSFLAAALAVHLLGTLLALAYPEFNIHRLLFPPAPDLSVSFERDVSGVISEAVDGRSKLITYVTLLSSPFYLMAAYQFRKRCLTFALLLALPLYISYCTVCYLGRGEALSHLCVFVLTLWFDNPRARKYILLVGLAMLPLVATALHEYQAIRLGASAEKMAWHESLLTMAQDETGFPMDADAIIDTDSRADLGKYALWLITLPVPKAVTGAISTSSISYEISQILVNQDVDQRGAYIRLAGLVTESIYLFGDYFFWLHALFLGAIMAAICRIFEKHAPLLIVTLSIILTFSYDLNRAGVSAAMPPLINNHLIVAFWLAYLYFRQPTPADREVAEHLRAARSSYSWALRSSDSGFLASATASPARIPDGIDKHSGSGR